MADQHKPLEEVPMKVMVKEGQGQDPEKETDTLMTKSTSRDSVKSNASTSRKSSSKRVSFSKPERRSSDLPMSIRLRHYQGQGKGKGRDLMKRKSTCEDIHPDDDTSSFFSKVRLQFKRVKSNALHCPHLSILSILCNSCPFNASSTWF